MAMDTITPNSSASTAAIDTIDTIDADNVPTSFGVFKPVGHLMVGVPAQAQADRLEASLAAAGWPPDAMHHFAPRESVAELGGDFEAFANEFAVWIERLERTS